MRRQCSTKKLKQSYQQTESNRIGRNRIEFCCQQKQQICTPTESNRIESNRKTPTESNETSRIETIRSTTGRNWFEREERILSQPHLSTNATQAANEERGLTKLKSTEDSQLSQKQKKPNCRKQENSQR